MISVRIVELPSDGLKRAAMIEPFLVWSFCARVGNSLLGDLSAIGERFHLLVCLTLEV